MSAPSSGTSRHPGTWRSRRAVLSSVALVVWIPGCAIACWWQVGVGRAGDALGWVYAVMWPCFALFGTIFWWHLVHDDPDTLGRRALQRRPPGPGTARADGRGTDEGAASGDEGRDAEAGDAADAIRRAEDADPELAAYNAYLAALARQDRASGRPER